MEGEWMEHNTIHDNIKLLLSTDFRELIRLRNRVRNKNDLARLCKTKKNKKWRI